MNDVQNKFKMVKKLGKIVYKVYKHSDTTWIIMCKTPFRYIGEFENIKIARQVCKYYNSLKK